MSLIYDPLEAQHGVRTIIYTRQPEGRGSGAGRTWHGVPVTISIPIDHDAHALNGR